MAPKRQFSHLAHKKYDARARDVFAKFLRSIGFTIDRNVEAMDEPDIIATDPFGVQKHYELEVKVRWQGKWPDRWPEIRIPKRKGHMANKYKKMFFIVFREGFEQFWYIKSESITPDRLREADNAGPGITPGEKFFHVPFAEAKLQDVDLVHRWPPYVECSD